jgi:hypothetical protein
MAKRKTVETPEDFFLRLLTHGERKPFLIASPTDDVQREAIKGLADTILNYLRSHLQEQEMLPLLQPERVVVITIPLATVQALTVWMDPVHTIAVNSGLMLFMYRVARALAPHIITRGPKDPPPPPESEAISIIATLLDWMSSPVRAPLIQDWPTGPREIRTAENIATAGERFVVNHEISHILCRHLIVNTSEVDPSKLTPYDLQNRPTEQEIEADVIGASLSIESMFEQQLDPRAGAVGIMIFLQSLRLAEEVGAIVSDRTHPSASDRLEVLWQTLPHRFGPDFAYLTSWADELSGLMNRVGNIALQERNKRRQKAVAYMDRIFREHPGMLGPRRDPASDKALLDETLKLLLTAPSAVLEAVADNLLDADEYRRALRFEEDRARRHSIAHFFARYMPNNVRPVLGVEMPLFTEADPKI